MCTVTFIPAGHTVFLTHNRDEKIIRKPALPPQQYTVRNVKMLFPKDGKAGGSWIGVNETGHAAVLLNGAFRKHHSQPPYRKSRGLVFLELLSSSDIHDGYHSTDLDRIEPFTVILWDGKLLAECRWDGHKKHIKHLSATKPHIWSSATLYEDAIIQTRNTWFNDWLRLHPAPTSDDILKFHSEGGAGDRQNDLRINRNDALMTLSITSIEMNKDKAIIKYIDLTDESLHKQELQFLKAPVNS